MVGSLSDQLLLGGIMICPHSKPKTVDGRIEYYCEIYNVSSNPIPCTDEEDSFGMSEMNVCDYLNGREE